MAETVLLLIKYKYLILFPIAAIEGLVVSLAAGFLVYTGVLNIVPTYIILVLGDFIPDTIYYYIGRLGDHKKMIEKYGEKIKFVKGGFKTIEHLWNNHPRKTMLFAKVTFGMSIPFLLSAGLFKIPYRKFISYTLPITFIQCGVVLSLGYFLGKSYEIAVGYIHFSYTIVSITFLIIFAGYIFFIKRYSKKKFEEIEKEEEKNIKI